MIPYPQTLPRDAVTNLIEMISTKSFEKDRFALSLWNLQGYAQSIVLPSEGFNASPTPTDQNALEALNDLNTPEDEGFSGYDVALRIILKWALTKALLLL